MRPILFVTIGVLILIILIMYLLKKSEIKITEPTSLNIIPPTPDLVPSEKQKSDIKISDLIANPAQLPFTKLIRLLKENILKVIKTKGIFIPFNDDQTVQKVKSCKNHKDLQNFCQCFVK